MLPWADALDRERGEKEIVEVEVEQEQLQEESIAASRPDTGGDGGGCRLVVRCRNATGWLV